MDFSKMTTQMCSEFPPKVYITRQIPQTGLDMLLGRCHVSFWDSPDPAPRTELLMNIPGCDVLVCMPTDKIDREILNAAGPSLKIVATMSEDSNHIETSECTRRNIRILTLPKVTKTTVTQMAIALLRIVTTKWMGSSSSNLNKIVQSKDIVQATKEDSTYCLELSNRTIGIVGTGALGISLGKTLKDLGVSAILYHDVEPVTTISELDAVFVEKEELFAKSDIICVCWNVESNGKNTCIFDKDAFKKMKNTAILIDITKGFSADFSDLYDALRTEEIAAAGLDVREYDVIPNRHPLAVLENCFFLPFRECYKWDGRRKCSVELAKSILTTLQELEFAKKAQNMGIFAKDIDFEPSRTIPAHAGQV